MPGGSSNLTHWLALAVASGRPSRSALFIFSLVSELASCNRLVLASRPMRYRTAPPFEAQEFSASNRKMLSFGEESLVGQENSRMVHDDRPPLALPRKRPAILWLGLALVFGVLIALFLVMISG